LPGQSWQKGKGRQSGPYQTRWGCCRKRFRHSRVETAGVKKGPQRDLRSTIQQTEAGTKKKGERRRSTALDQKPHRPRGELVYPAYLQNPLRKRKSCDDPKQRRYDRSRTPDRSKPRGDFKINDNHYRERGYGGSAVGADPSRGSSAPEWALSLGIGGGSNIKTLLTKVRTRLRAREKTFGERSSAVGGKKGKTAGTKRGKVRDGPFGEKRGTGQNTYRIKNSSKNIGRASVSKIT